MALDGAQISMVLYSEKASPSMMMRCWVVFVSVIPFALAIFRKDFIAELARSFFVVDRFVFVCFLLALSPMVVTLIILLLV